MWHDEESCCEMKINAHSQILAGEVYRKLSATTWWAWADVYIWFRNLNECILTFVNQSPVKGLSLLPEVSSCLDWWWNKWCFTLVTAVFFRLVCFTYIHLGSEHLTAFNSPVTLSHDYFIFGIKTVNTWNPFAYSSVWGTFWGWLHWYKNGLSGL